MNSQLVANHNFAVAEYNLLVHKDNQVVLNYIHVVLTTDLLLVETNSTI